MSITSALSKIRAAVETRLDEGLIPAILDKGINRHAGRGLRDCTCDFCKTKREGTWDIAYAAHGSFRTYMLHGGRRLGQHAYWLDPYDDDWWAYKMFKEAAREKKREILRLKLAKAKETVI